MIYMILVGELFRVDKIWWEKLIAWYFFHYFHATEATVSYDVNRDCRHWTVGMEICCLNY